MNAEHIRSLLIDYAEGVLPAEQSAELETMLNNSAALREELELIRSTLLRLNEQTSETVPDHYFTNFLSRLRLRLQNDSRGFRRFTPWFLDLFIRPAFVMAGLLILMTAYQLFEPQTTASPIYDLVSEFAQDEISAVLNESAIMYTGPDDVMVDVSFVTVSFGEDVSQYATENNLNTMMEEQELEQVVQQLETRIIQ